MLLTPQQAKAYAKNPNACPICGSWDITADHFEIGDDNIAERSVTCYKCGEVWTETFTMTDVDGTPINERRKTNHVLAVLGLLGLCAWVGYRAGRANPRRL